MPINSLTPKVIYFFSTLVFNIFIYANYQAYNHNSITHDNQFIKMHNGCMI